MGDGKKVYTEKKAENCHEHEQAQRRSPRDQEGLSLVLGQKKEGPERPQAIGPIWGW